MNLKPQDPFVLLKLIALEEKALSYAALANSIFMSVSEVHASIKRSEHAGLVRSKDWHVYRKKLEDFIIHGVRYAYPATRGTITRGIPTAYAAYPLSKMITVSEDDIPPVWSDPEGSVRGYALSPLYKSVPKAVKQDEKLYGLLACVDAIRMGRARERAIAIREIENGLKPL